MKGKITALIVGLVLGSTGVAVGASTIAPWRHTAPSYICKGDRVFANCSLRYTPYSVSAGKGSVVIFYGNHPQFMCQLGRLPGDCFDFR
jgi:hypothetical protein